MILNNNRPLLAISLAAVCHALAPVLLRVSEGYTNAGNVVFVLSWIGFVFLATLKVGLHFLSQYRSRTQAVIFDDGVFDDGVFDDGVSLGGNCQEDQCQKAQCQKNQYQKNQYQKSQRLSLRQFFSLPPTLFSALVGVTVTNLGNKLLWAGSMTQTTVAISGVLNSLSPPITALASWILFSQMFGRKFILGLVLSTIGTVTIFVGDMSSVTNLRGDGFALLSAVFYAAQLISVEKLRERWSSTDVVMWIMGSTAFLCAPILWMMGDIQWLLPWRGWLSLVLLSLDVTSAWLLVSYCLKSMSAALVATILLMSPCLTALLGWLFFSETLGWLSFLGFIIVLIGVYFSVTSESEQEDKQRGEGLSCPTVAT